MKQILLLTLLVFCCLVPSFAQTKENRPFTSFSDINCEYLLATSDGVLETLKENPDSKAYIVFYEGKHSRMVRGGKYKLFNPRVGEGRNHTEAISLYLTKWRKLPKERIVIIDGGYDSNYRVDIWIVPKNGESPKSNPTLTKKDIKFSKGKLLPVTDCQKIYSEM